MFNNFVIVALYSFLSNYQLDSYSFWLPPYRDLVYVLVLKDLLLFSIVWVPNNFNNKR